MGSIAHETAPGEANLGTGVIRDFSRPFNFNLQSQTLGKTVDIGKDGVSLSLDAFGCVLQASTFHPEHGIVVAVPFEQFDGTRFYDPSYVRSYRTRMLQMIRKNKPGFGLYLGADLRSVDIRIRRANMVCFDFRVQQTFDVSLVVKVSDSGEIQQTATVTNIGSEPATLPYTFNLCISLNRASYGQLTEGGPLPIPASHNILRRNGGGDVNITNPILGAQLTGHFELNRDPVYVSSVIDQEVRGVPLEAMISGAVSVEPGTSSELRARFRLSPRSTRIASERGNEKGGEELSETGSWIRDGALTTYMLRRNVDYILGNCLIPISDSETCVITDHVALPLGWNRDNYWQIRLLLETNKYRNLLLEEKSGSKYGQQIHDAAKGHLNWVFKTAQRPHGYWHRSYLVTGKPKDHAIFQLDQQCYPLLELCDYLDYFPDESDFVKELAQSDAVGTIVRLLEAKRDAETGLWPTDETPGDDAVIYPYHFSSHILLWRTVTRLRDLHAQFHLPTDPEVLRLNSLAQKLRSQTLESFTVPHTVTGKQVFAYLTNGCDKHTFYHDGNDIPTLFAREWDFVTSPTEISTWHNTMAFALSPLNTQGYCNEGPYRGLGSVHSPGAWVLGYFQELAYAVEREDTAAMQEAWRKVTAAMQWDGTFPEAVDPNTAECSSKAWFSWPGSMIGALIIKLKVEGLEDLLLQREEEAG
ncbi:hypothetical protein K458DRAFT_364017 [Lentithecium fluviatile CBS 122367]|uniref:Glycoside hydrolase family 63 protein n=1 Tax=Lentithecium fluviatile CBS 122367 TaxID=1168545 RepID=A0A6G1J7S8_9PLEO|nr:hypothetical protein K458DRAFT_364017 [Lentithecium fluviatile CBS 122367]